MEAENTMEMIKDEVTQEETSIMMYALLNKRLLTPDSVLATNQNKDTT